MQVIRRGLEDTHERERRPERAAAGRERFIDRSRDKSPIPSLLGMPVGSGSVSSNQRRERDYKIPSRRRSPFGEDRRRRDVRRFRIVFFQVFLIVKLPKMGIFTRLFMGSYFRWNVVVALHRIETTTHAVQSDESRPRHPLHHSQSRPSSRKLWSESSRTEKLSLRTKIRVLEFLVILLFEV